MTAITVSAGCPCCGGTECVRPTTSARVTVGLTITDRDNNYVPTMDGYRPGAAQDMIVLNVPLIWLRELTGEQIAEALFIGTNHPYRETLHGLDGWVGRTWRGGRSLSVGDTIMFGDTRLACDHVGWVPA